MDAASIITVIGGVAKLIVDLATLIGRADLADPANEILEKAGFPKHVPAIKDKVDDIRARFGLDPVHGDDEDEDGGG